MSDGSDNSTVRSELRPLLPGVPFLELRVSGASGARAWPFTSHPLRFRLAEGAPEAADWTVEMRSDHRLHFCPDGAPPAVHIRLIGQELTLGAERLVVVDLRTLPPYRLVAMSPELNFRGWPLADGHHLIGRAGRRANAVTLTDASVSRTHARLEIQERTARLVAEAQGALTAVNGETLHPDAARELQPNDILQIGDLLFRWEREDRAFLGSTSGLRLRSLGGNSVWLGGSVSLGGPVSPGIAPHDELDFRNENARNLLFWLASRRGEELPVDRVLESYWPERPVLRQRKNLSHILKALQAELGWSDANFERHLIRTGDSLRLEPGAVESFDLWALRDAARRHHRERLSWRDLLELHRGVFLAPTRGGWVAVLRTELFLLWIGMLETAPVEALEPELRSELAQQLTRCLREGDFEEFVYERVFVLAGRLGLEGSIPLWLGELREQLLLDTGDAPSGELTAKANLLSRGAGRSE